YVIEKSWMNQFKEFVSSKIPNKNIGPLRYNSLIYKRALENEMLDFFQYNDLDAKFFHKYKLLRPNAMENQDYFLLIKYDFDRLEQIFGKESNDLIVRHTIRDSFGRIIIDVHLLELSILIFQENVQRAILNFSRYDTIKKVLEKSLTHFKNQSKNYDDAENCIKLHITLSAENNRIIELPLTTENLQIVLKDMCIQIGDIILIDFFDGREWSFKKLSKSTNMTNTSLGSRFLSNITSWLEYFGIVNPCLSISKSHAFLDHTELPVLCGLFNLGNTCFMNSGLQALFCIKSLDSFFSSQEYKNDINCTNPLGTRGLIAEAFYDLIKQILQKNSYTSSVSPKILKNALSINAPQFGDYEQQDAQELMTYLIEGLHEDLNRVIEKPYFDSAPAYEKNGHLVPDEELALESWNRHISRNNSVIVDHFHGMLKSTVICPKRNCNNLSITFDPFVFLSLPVPSFRKNFDCSVFYIDIERKFDSNLSPIFRKFNIPINQTNIRQKICCSLNLDIKEIMIYVSSMNHCKLTSLLPDSRNFIKNSSIVIFKRPTNANRQVPLVIEVCQDSVSVSKFTFVGFFSSNTIMYDDFLEQIVEYKKIFHPSIIDYSNDELKSFLNPYENCQQAVDESLLVMSNTKNGQNIDKKDDKLFNFNSNEDVTLFDCLNMYLSEEQLEHENSWYCNRCKNHVNAYKQLQLWKMPKVLLVHFNRFRYNFFSRNKITTPINFPATNLDLGSYVMQSSNSNSSPLVYDLMAVVNHSGSLSCGHYTATIYNEDYRSWFDCNDSTVTKLGSNGYDNRFDKSLAYILVYKKREISDEAN
ncbi:MAG: Ubiquitin carboxyl-terminal hydrolase 15, partial [Paramarteilia canceri]